MMFKTVFLILLRVVIFLLLTTLTQVGGVVYVVSFFCVKNVSKNRQLKQGCAFVIMYLILTLLIIPFLAPIFGREKVKDTVNIESHSFFYKLTNRNYVSPQLNLALVKISKDLEKEHKNIKLIYLDANFPFINGFPLFPHLSHNDGEKIDVSLIYKDEKGLITNKKPSVSGYGVYVKSTGYETNQPLICKKRGAWQYSFSQYLTFGRISKGISFSKEATITLMNSIVSQQDVSKVFIEPHLKQRMKLMSPKVRFHGCQAVRHDDHIHFQIK